MNLTVSSTAKEIEPLALTIHQLVKELPLTMRTKNSRGVRLEEGKVVDYDYTGPALEKALETGEKITEIPGTGKYKGVPVMVVPLIEGSEVVAAVGVVDTTQGIYSDLQEITKRPQPLDEERDDQP